MLRHFCYGTYHVRVKLMDVDGEIKVASIAKVRDKEASEETSVSEKENETASEKTQE